MWINEERRREAEVEKDGVWKLKRERGMGRGERDEMKERKKMRGERGRERHFNNKEEGRWR